MKRFFLILPLLLLCSCSSYLMQRADDLGDIVRFKLTTGPGLCAAGELTRYCIVGAGWYRSDSFGFANRRFGIWHEEAIQGGLIVGFHREFCVKTTWQEEKSREFYRGNFGFSRGHDGPYALTGQDSPVDAWTLRATCHIVVIGLDFEFRAGQLFDFLTGFFGYDFAVDDYDFDKPVEMEPAE